MLAYLNHRNPAAQNIEISDLHRIPGGASRETYALTAEWTEGGNDVRRPMIFRRDPTTGLIETERDIEFAAYQAFYGSGIPVPEPLYLETETEWLDRPFFVMERIVGGEVASPFALDPYGAHAPSLGEQFWTFLGSIARNTSAVDTLSDVLEPVAPAECWRRELDYWEGEILAHELEPQPLAQAAIRWLRKNPPPTPDQLVIVHGDYRTGNFLHDSAGKILAILDWEMVHLGDPHEDLAWGMDPIWCWFKKDHPGLMIPRAETIATWEKASGLRVNPDALQWWEVFSHVKGLAIWITASDTYRNSSNKDATLAFSSLICTDLHNQILAQKLPGLLGLEVGA